MANDRTKVISVHRTRRVARRRERDLQDAIYHIARQRLGTNAESFATYDSHGQALEVPKWARGARVEKAGLLQWAVVATEHRGH